MTATEFNDLDPRTPVVVGVGQSAERLEDSAYRGMSSVELAAAAGAAALSDTDVDPGLVADAIHTVAATRQFENSVPGARAPLGRSDNFALSVARRLGADPERAILDVAGGQSPQHLLTELAGAIADGDVSVALIFGAEAISTARHFAGRDDKPDFSETVSGNLEDRGYGLKGLTSLESAKHGLTDAPVQYALFENARRARLGFSRKLYARQMGELFAPFSVIAARNRFSATSVIRTPAELAEPSERNRPIADPYTRFLVARDQVNQGAAVLIMSVAEAQRLGISPDKWVFLHGHAELREKDLLDRDDLSRSPAAVTASRHALEAAGIGPDDVDFIDLYSCFPIAVTNVADELGWSPDDPRGLTVTGGLPFFGGAGNNYSMHAIAEVVERCRADSSRYGFVGANGGVLSKYSVGVYSARPTAWRADSSVELQAEIDSLPGVPTVEHADGPATIETYTVRHARDGRRTGIVIGRLDSTGERFLAMTIEDDEPMLDLLSRDEPIGQRIHARSFGFGNRVTTDMERMVKILPIKDPGFKESYEHILVRRDGHLLEITLNRPEARNSLHPPAHEELESVFDAYFADPDLWVAIITGQGTKSFCAGNDLIYTTTGKPMYVPKSGFGGLTSRRHLPKPIIAAVNGFAMGGGLEIALACHLIVADQHAQLALSEVQVGLIAGAGGLVRLPRQLPVKVANEMILTGRRMGAQEALDRGLVNVLTAPGQAVAGARELAAQIIQGSPTSVRISLQVMEETAGVPDPVDAVTQPSTAFDDLMFSEDTAEGLAAFAAKRAPQWRNR